MKHYADMLGSALIDNLLPASRLEVGETAEEDDCNVHLVSCGALNTDAGEQNRISRIVGQIADAYLDGGQMPRRIP